MGGGIASLKMQLSVRSVSSGLEDWMSESQSAASLSLSVCMAGWGIDAPRQGDIPVSKHQRSSRISTCARPTRDILDDSEVFFSRSGAPPSSFTSRKPLFFKTLGQHGIADDH